MFSLRLPEEAATWQFQLHPSLEFFTFDLGPKQTAFFFAPELLRSTIVKFVGEPEAPIRCDDDLHKPGNLWLVGCEWTFVSRPCGNSCPLPP